MIIFLFFVYQYYGLKFKRNIVIGNYIDEHVVYPEKKQFPFGAARFWGNSKLNASERECMYIVKF